jgi:esterase/lipase
MNKKKDNRVILLIHGFKRGNENDFEYLEDPLMKFNLPIINFEYYDNYDKKTLN